MRPLMNRKLITGPVGTFSRCANSARRRVQDGQRSGEEGFTLAEVIVSIALFTVFSIAVMFALVTLVKYTGITQSRVAAANLARQEVEKLRGQNSTLSQLDVTASSVNLKGTIYTVTPLLSPGGNIACTPGASRNATVTVTWNSSGSRAVRYDTVLSC